MPNLRWQELLIIVALVLLLFGAKRLPDAARGLGRSLRIFKAETKGLVDGEEDGETSGDAAGGATAQAPAPPSGWGETHCEPSRVKPDLRLQARMWKTRFSRRRGTLPAAFFTSARIWSSSGAFGNMG